MYTLTRRSILGFALFGVLCSNNAGIVHADPPNAVQSNLAGTRMVAEFNAWARDWGVANAAFSVHRGTAVLGSTRRGTYTTTQAVPVASLSKAITGVCIARLTDDRRFTYQSQIGTLIPSYFASNPPADSRARQVTVAQLLTHTSGNTNDISQGRFPPGLIFSQINLTAQLRASLGVRLAYTPGTNYYYNNINYVALGLIIERFSNGLSYESYCRNRVLTPVGVRSASLNPSWRIMGPYGGWRISVNDYAKFQIYFDPRRTPIRKPMSQWPEWRFSSGARYSIGILFRVNSDGTRNWWHAGSWGWSSPPASFGAYQVTMRNDLRWVAAYSPRVTNAAALDLDRRMWRAGYP